MKKKRAKKINTNKKENLILLIKQLLNKNKFSFLKKGFNKRADGEIESILLKKIFKKLADLRKKVRIASTIKNKYLPHISRFFTAERTGFNFKIFILGIMILMVGFIGGKSAIYRQKVLGENKKNLEKRHEEIKKLTQLEREIDYWEELVLKRKDYRDGYLKLAGLNYQTGRFLTAKEYLDKAWELDPNNEATQILAKILKQDKN